ncbi:MAG: hypothetical protein M3345_07570 [Actinomycetota bacterium]|nr:hypothetical protein [Actinomycetota bacterium]
MGIEVGEALRWVGFAVGTLAAVATWGSVIRTLVLPRGSSRLTVLVGRSLTRGLFLSLSRRADDYETKDRILARSGPLALLLILFAWMALFVLAYGLMLWPLVGGRSFGQALLESGSSLLSLGFAGTHTFGATIVHFAAAATGLIVIALEIAFLPVLYSAFNRREVLVTLLQSRAGSPAWGPELLARHQVVGIVDNLGSFYSEWEQWAADIAESHSNYTVLLWFRSPHPLRSWIVGLLAVLDSAALYQALCPSTAPSETRLCLRMGFTCLRDIASAIRLPFDPDPFPDDPIQLTYEEYLTGIERLRDIGFPMERTPEEAWPHFKGWRVNYEAVAYALADSTNAAPGPWSGPRTHLAGVTIVPQRPANRRPEDPDDQGRVKGHSGY